MWPDDKSSRVIMLQDAHLMLLQRHKPAPQTRVYSLRLLLAANERNQNALCEKHALRELLRLFLLMSARYLYFLKIGNCFYSARINVDLHYSVNAHRSTPLLNA